MGVDRIYANQMTDSGTDPEDESETNPDIYDTENEGGEDEIESVSIAFSFEDAVLKLENPKDVFDSVSKWSEYVGITSDKPQHVVNGFCAKRNIHIDFFTGPQGGKVETLEKAKDEIRLDADEYFYIGASKRDEVIAEKAGWKLKEGSQED
ncbi:MAG: hypothetical protein SXQ77_06430 [Halobacteria archaeon]|nr:hypothetical protein [Halobacteria archaeon]